MDDIRYEAEQAWQGEGSYRILWSDGGEWTNDGPVWVESVEDLAGLLEGAYEDSTETHLPYVEAAPMRRAAFIEAYRTGYNPDQCSTMTIGELMGYLQELADELGEDAEVFLRHDRGFTYGGIGWGDIRPGQYDEDHCVVGEEW